jgi:hypothetical protein
VVDLNPVIDKVIEILQKVKPSGPKERKGLGMSIIRVKKSEKYTSIKNTVINDSRLSWKARGILIFLLSKTANWEISIKNLANEGGCGKAAIYSALKELKAVGYVVIDVTRNEKKRIIHHEYLVYEEPQKPMDIKAEPLTENRKVAFSDPLTENLNPDNLNPDNLNPENRDGKTLNKDNHEKTTTTIKSSSPSFSLDEIFSMIPETERTKQVKALIRKHLKKSGPEAVKDAIAYTNAHEPKKYKSYLGVMLDNGGADGYLADSKQAKAETEQREKAAREKAAAEKREQTEREAEHARKLAALPMLANLKNQKALEKEFIVGRNKFEQKQYRKRGGIKGIPMQLAFLNFCQDKGVIALNK